MKENFLIKILYKTVPGRFLLKILVEPKISKIFAVFLSSHFSKIIIPFFVSKYKVDISKYDVPKYGYKSFNDFFIRKKKEEDMLQIRGELISPCDGLLTIANINDESYFKIKHTIYSLNELLNSSGLAEAYHNGTALIFRLTPAHYHRYIWTTSGFVCFSKFIPGVLHSVQPICNEITKVFVQNTREYVVINNFKYGNIIQMEVGALLVGKINNYKTKHSQMITAGQEKGYFEYGGSTIIVLIKNRVEINNDILNRSKIGSEIPVVLGENLI